MLQTYQTVMSVEMFVSVVQTKQDICTKEQSELLGLLKRVIGEVNKPFEKRSRVSMEAVFAGIGKLVEGISKLQKLWNYCYPLVIAVFSNLNSQYYKDVLCPKKLLNF